MTIILLRAAAAADVPALQTLLRASWHATWAPALKPQTVARFRALDPAGAYAAEKWGAFIVADEAGVLRGMFHVEADHLHAIHLDPAVRRRGIGTLLMDDAERGIARGHREATLDVLAFNTAAIAFYEQRGWTRRRAMDIDETGEAVAAFEMTKLLRA